MRWLRCLPGSRISLCGWVREVLGSGFCLEDRDGKGVDDDGFM